jgi:NADH-quinone oxidoreductase subunit I
LTPRKKKKINLRLRVFYMAGYFKDIWLGVSTVLIGMHITFKHWFKFKKAVTIQYPHEILEMNERTRAHLFNVADECAVCLQCARACPVDIIDMQGIRADKDEDLGLLPTGKPKRMHLIKFDIDFSKCVYCGLCVEVCDTKSLHWRAPVEPCTFTREEMYKSFATIPPDEVERLIAFDAERKVKKAEEMAAKKAAAAAAKAAKAAKAKAEAEAKPAEAGADAPKAAKSDVGEEKKETPAASDTPEKPGTPDSPDAPENTPKPEPDKS